LVDRLNYLLVAAWITVATFHYKEMAIEVMGKLAIASSLRPEPEGMSPMVVYLANTLIVDYWKVMELMLAFRYFVDVIVGREKASNLAVHFYQYSRSPVWFI
jgi:hypothetical protein